MHTPSFSYTRQNWEAIPIELMEKDVQKMESEGAEDAPIYRKLLEEAKLKQRMNPAIVADSDKKTERATLRDAGQAYVEGSKTEIPCETPGDGNLLLLRDALKAFDENKSNLRDAERILSGDY